MQEYGKAKAVRYDSVTALFTDFKNFTQIAKNLPPEALVSNLDTCFGAFDEIITRYGLEKIKTIGDAYMCAGGLPSPMQDHAIAVANAALEIRDFMDKFNAQNKHNEEVFYDIRLGIHSSQVVAGVVASTKFAYDIKGIPSIRQLEWRETACQVKSIFHNQLLI